MANKRIFTVYYDVVNKKLRNASGFPIGAPERPYIVFREKPIMNLYLVTGDNLARYTDFAGTEVFSAAIDNNFDHTDDLMCKTDNTGINVAGDWAGSSSGQANPAQGEFSIELNANTTSYESKISTNREKRDCYFELLAFDNVTGDMIASFQFNFRALNLLDDDDSAPPATVISNYVWFYKDGQQCLRIRNDDGTTLVEFCPPGV